MPNSNELMHRQWTMLRLIPRYPRKITARELMLRIQSEGYAVTKRTIERDLQSMSIIFPLIADDQEKPYGWSWSKDAPVFDLPGLSTSEALTFKMAEQYLRDLLPQSMLVQLNPYFEAASRALNSQSTNSQLAKWPEKIAVAAAGQPLIPPSVNADILDLLDEALLKEQQIDVIYSSRNEGDSMRYTLHPLGLILRGCVHYLVATVFQYQDIRLFATHRIKEITLLDSRCSRPKNFNLKEYAFSGALGFNDYGKIQFKAKFTYEAGQHLYETPLSEDQIIIKDEIGDLVVSATVSNNSQLHWWIRGFGDQVEVISPASLVDLI